MQMGLPMVPIHTNEYLRPCVPLRYKDADMYTHEYLCLVYDWVIRMQMGHTYGMYIIHEYIP